MLHKPSKSSDARLRRKKHRYPSIRLRLIFTVNAALALLLTAFLAYDYRHQLNQQIESRRIALEEEAKTLLHATLQMRHHGEAAVQEHIEVVCADMGQSHTPEHFVVVESESTVLHASTLNRDHPGVVEALKRAARSPNQRTELGDSELIVGLANSGRLTLYVAEDVATVRRTVLRDVSRRLIGLIVLGMVGALIVNFVLFRVVTRPLKQLVGTIRQVSRGSACVKTQEYRSAEFNYLANEIDAMVSELAANERSSLMEMAKARRIQQHLMPDDICVPGLNISYLYQPADSVGGDYYDVLQLPNGSYLFCVADVTGHGVPAALTAAMLKTMLASATETQVDPVKILQHLNERLVSATPTEHFVTMILVSVDVQQQTLLFASAGHEAGWLLAASGELVELDSTGFPVGIQEGARWRSGQLRFEAGARLLLLSDGVAEAYNNSREMFGRERIVELLRESKDLDVEKTVARIDRTLTDFRDYEPRSDDVTLLMIEMSVERESSETVATDGTASMGLQPNNDDSKASKNDEFSNAT